MYTKTNWLARVGTALNRFLKTNETSTEVELTNDPTGVTTAGTPFTVANMNKIEQGIYDAHVGLDNNGLIDNTRINQDVRTTASPTFATVNATDVVTTNGPNKPVDNNDTSMPSVGIGGFSYAVGSSESGPPSITIGSGGTWVYVAQSSLSIAPANIVTTVGRVAGGSNIQGLVSVPSGNTALLYVIAWRIA